MLQKLFKRWLSQRNAEVRSWPLWDAAGAGNRLANWSASPITPNAWWDNPLLVRSRAEGEFRNNAFARRLVDSLVNAAWGANAINPQFKERSIQEAWEKFSAWWWVSKGALLLQTVIVSGEAFVLLTLDPELPGVPLRLEVLGPEFLDTSRADRNTIGGIQYDGPRPAGYWLFPRNPVLTGYLPSVLVPAENVLHVYRAIAPGAQRGQSWLAPVLLPLRELMEYLEAALVQKKIASLLTGFIRTPDGSNPLTAKSSTPTLEPGAMVRLQPGEEVEFSKPPEITDLDAFARAQPRRIAAGMGVPYETISGDLSQVTFASGRHGLLEFKRTTEAIQYGLLVPQFCEPVMRRWARLAVALGVIEREPGRVRWIGPTPEMLDPRMETLAMVNRIRAGLMSRSEAVLQMGWRAEDVDREIAEDNRRADALGLTYDSDPRKTTAQGQSQQDGGTQNE